jgi:hypothetical protein
MKLSRRRQPKVRRRILAGSIAGLAAAAAYAVEQKADLDAFDYNTDDFVLLGSMVPVDEELIRPLGMVMHFGNGAALGAVYALVAHDRLPGPPLARGLTFTMLETVGLYPMALLEGFHPGISEGRLPSYLTGQAFAQQVLRHFAYGVVLGPLTERLLHRK